LSNGAYCSGGGPKAGTTDTGIPRFGHLIQRPWPKAISRTRSPESGHAARTGLRQVGAFAIYPRGRSHEPAPFHMESGSMRLDDRIEMIARLERWSVPEPMSGCWLWFGNASKSGYGQFTYKRVPIRAHRGSYMVHKGEIPEGMVIDHLCRNTYCINPDHLECVTQRENTMRGLGPSSLNAKKTHCKRGHELTPENIYSYAGERNCRVCRRMRGIEGRARRRAARLAKAS